MTDPALPPVTVEQLQHTVEELIDEVKRLQFSNSRLAEQLRDVREHQDTVVRAVNADRKEVVDLLAAFETRLAPAAGAGQANQKPPPQPQPWTDRATAGDVDALIERFEKLMSLYEPTTDLRPDAGWPLHRGVVEQVAAVCTAWAAAALEDEAARAEGTGSSALADWELGVWQPMLRHISTGNMYSKGTATPKNPWKGTDRGATYLNPGANDTQQGGN